MNEFALTEEQWRLVQPLLPPPPPKRGRGKPATPIDKIVNTVLFTVVTDAKWECVPRGDKYASKSAAHRKYQEWKSDGTLAAILETLSL